MTSAFKRAFFSCTAAVFFACALPAMPADSDLAPAASALSTKLTSDDVYNNSAGKKIERLLTIDYTVKVTGPCELTIHRDGNSTYPYIGRSVVQPTDPVTYYMVPIAAMATATTANEKSGQQAVLSVSGASQNQVYTYSEDTVVPLAGLKTGLDPVSVSSQSTPMRYPTFTSADAAKAAIAALAKAAATCAK